MLVMIFILILVLALYKPTQKAYKKDQNIITHAKKIENFCMQRYRENQIRKHSQRMSIKNISINSELNLIAEHSQLLIVFEKKTFFFKC